MLREDILAGFRATKANKTPEAIIKKNSEKRIEDVSSIISYL